MTRTAEPAAREIVDLGFLLVGRMQRHFEATAATFGLPVTEAKALLRLGSGISMREAFSARLYEDVPIVTALSAAERRTFHELLARAVSG